MPRDGYTHEVDAFLQQHGYLQTQRFVFAGKDAEPNTCLFAKTNTNLKQHPGLLLILGIGREQVHCIVQNCSVT